jgi:hypothetical protein
MRKWFLLLVLAGCGSGPSGGEIAGTWIWFDTPTVYIDPGGDLRAPGTSVLGRWASVDAHAALYQLDWYNGFVDRLTLSADGNHLDGSNQYGTHVTADRDIAK